MYNEQFNQLIAATLADGQLTEKEVDVLCRRAEAMGIDRDEFVIYLEGKLVERQLQLQAMPGATQMLRALTTPTRQPTAPIVPARPAAVRAVPAKPVASVTPDPIADHEEMGKCPACKETISGLSHVCPSCGLVIDADHATHGNLEEMLEEQEQLLLQAKALVRQSAAAADLGLEYLLAPFSLICVGALCIGYSTTRGWFVVGLICWLSALVLYRKSRMSVKAGDAGRFLPELQEKFEKNDRQIALFFGDDSKVGQVLDTLRQQMAATVATVRVKKTKSFGYILVRLVVLMPILLAMFGREYVAAPPDKDADFPDERPVQIQTLLDEQNLPAARDLLAQLPDTNASRPALLAAFYAASQNHRLDSLRELLPQRDYAAVHRGLLRLWWNTDLGTDTASRSAFEARKRQLNTELPARYRLNEGWLTATGSRD